MQVPFYGGSISYFDLSDCSFPNKTAFVKQNQQWPNLSKVAGQSFYDGNVVSNIQDLLVANRHQLALCTVFNDAVSFLESKFQSF